MNDPALTLTSVERLVRNIERALTCLPASSSARLTKVPYFLMHGTSSGAGGKDSGLEYIHPGDPSLRPELDPRWGNSIIVYNAQNYAQLSELWAQKTVMHELAHAHHFLRWKPYEPAIMHAYKYAMERNLYRQVRDIHGHTLAEAYATTNHFEYFAELTCMYFAKCPYQPFDRPGLERYDPQGLSMIEQFWELV